jgi:hypothetical protein
MKKLIIILLMGLMPIFACEYEDEKRIEVENMYDYYFENDIPEMTSINDVIFYIRDHIEYTGDDGEYWQLPEETYYRRNDENKMLGDCEDFVILFQYLVETKLNISTCLISVDLPDQEDNHAMAFVNGIFYDIQGGKFIIQYTSLNPEIKIRHIIPYTEVIWMTYYYHHPVGKYSW